jgi:hypothetical protein
VSALPRHLVHRLPSKLPYRSFPLNAQRSLIHPWLLRSAALQPATGALLEGSVVSNQLRKKITNIK